MVNYSEGKIYKLVNDVDDKIYVGSSCQKLWKRFSSHKEYMVKDGYKDSKLYSHMNSLGKEHFDIILIENFPCKDKDELRAREDYYIKYLKAELNTKGAILDISKCDAHLKSEEYKEKQRQYRELNREKQRQYMKKYCEAGKKKSKDKAYYEKNKERLKLKAKEYYDTHKEEQNIKSKERYNKNKLLKV